MSNFTQKSDENFNAIDILMSSKLYAPVIHCAYYSSLQLVIHYTYEYCGITEVQKAELKINSGSHNFFINKFTEEVKKFDTNHAVKFYKFFNTFKRKRTEADYDDLGILENDVIDAKERARKLRKFLKQLCEDGKCENVYDI